MALSLTYGQRTDIAETDILPDEVGPAALVADDVYDAGRLSKSPKNEKLHQLFLQGKPTQASERSYRHLLAMSRYAGIGS